MALSVSQAVAASFNAVLNEKRKPSNQWAENATMREMEKQGAIVTKSFGVQLEKTLDYRRNPSFAFQATELQPISLSRTEVLTAAVYDFAELSGSIVWTFRDEVVNSSDSQKVDLVKSITTNGITSHDDVIEQALWATSTNGFLGFGTHIPTSGQGSDGGIDSAVETMWRNVSNTYVDDTDIESAFTSTWNSCAKGSGSSMAPTMMASDGATQALFEGTQQANQRYVDDQELKAGFKVLAFKTARYIFSQYGSTSVYFTNASNFRLEVSKDAFRKLGEMQELQNGTGYRRLVYSAAQVMTDNKSRLGVAHL